MNKELLLTVVPQNIAVISSPTAAGFEDFVDQLQKNQFGYKFTITLFKAVMQGQEAIDSIINSLMRIYNHAYRYDVAIIIRGGGSQVDFDCFDSYDLTSHVAQFPLPVITGIGHDRDETVTDLVAHTKMKTPTAVAEFLISGLMSFENSLLENLKILNQAAKGAIMNQDQTLNELYQKVCSQSQEILMMKTSNLKFLTEKLKNNIVYYLNQSFNQLEILDKSITLMDPKNTLKRGYTLTTINNRLLKYYSHLKKGDLLQTESDKFIIKSKLESHTQK